MTQASGYEHKAAYIKCCERPPRSNIEMYIVDYGATGETTRPRRVVDQNTRTMTTVTETIRPRITNVVAAYSDAYPNTKYHVTAEDKVMKNLLKDFSILKDDDEGCIDTECDNCTAQYRNRKFLYWLAMFRLKYGVRRMHTFATPHHFKGQHDGVGRDERDNLVSAELEEQERMPTTFDAYDYNVRTRQDPNTSSRNNRGQYAFDKIQRIYCDTANSQDIRAKFRDADYHEEPRSTYVNLDTVTAQSDNTKIPQQKLYYQYGGFEQEVNSDGSIYLWMREFPCCCPACRRFDWDECINTGMCGEWVRKLVRQTTVGRDTATAQELDDFRKKMKKGNIIAMIGDPDEDDMDEEARAASFWLGIMQIGVQSVTRGPYTPDPDKYDGTVIPLGDYYTRVRWLKPIDAPNLKYQWEDSRECVVNMVGAIRVSGLQWARQTSNSFYLRPDNYEKIIEQAEKQIRADEDSDSELESDDGDMQSDDADERLGEDDE